MTVYGVFEFDYNVDGKLNNKSLIEKVSNFFSCIFKVGNPCKELVPVYWKEIKFEQTIDFQSINEIQNILKHSQLIREPSNLDEYNKKYSNKSYKLKCFGEISSAEKELIK